MGMQQRVEILKAFYRDARLLILDEPTAMLTPQETRELFKIINNLKTQGISILFISHKLDEVMEISDRVTVMRRGKTVRTLNTRETNEQELANLMVGREVKLVVEKSEPRLGETVLSGQNVMVYIMFVLIVLSQWFLFKTTVGLRLRAVGENPEAAETAGIDVVKMKYLGVILGGAFSALGGAYLSIGALNSFSPEMSSGRGYIALAAMIFGRWTPVGSFLASLLFGFATALSYSLQEFTVSKNIIMMLPYIVTILALVGIGGKSVAPAADGVPYRPKK